MIKLTVDTIIEYPNGEIVLVKRGNNPFKDMWCLPGGMVEENETVEAAAIREAKEETGIDIKLVKLIGVFSDPERDPRGHYVSVTFHAIPIAGNLQSGSDAKDAMLMDLNKIPELGFDHREIIEKFKAGRINSF